jgi:acyl-CoA synthetase (AMP-forming)/AMP-acid ligase II
MSEAESKIASVCREHLDVGQEAFSLKWRWKSRSGTTTSGRIHRRDAIPRNPLTRSLIDRGFSSGSTGKSKAAFHDFVAVLEKFKVPRHRRRMLTFLLLDHLGGINTLFHALSNEGAAVAVGSRDPEVICRAIEQFRVQILPTNPTFLNLLLLSSAHRQFDLPSLETITYGTEAMPQETLDRLHEAFPNVRPQRDDQRRRAENPPGGSRGRIVADAQCCGCCRARLPQPHHGAGGGGHRAACRAGRSRRPQAQSPRVLQRQAGILPRFRPWSKLWTRAFSALGSRRRAGSHTVRAMR